MLTILDHIHQFLNAQTVPPYKVNYVPAVTFYKAFQPPIDQHEHLLIQVALPKLSQLILCTKFTL